jgi:hypothetical protein
MAEISSHARTMMRKALGINHMNPIVSRNRYFQSKESRAWVIWADLVRKGYAAYEPAKEGTLDFFSVTGKGFDAIRQTGEAASINEDAAMRLLNSHPSVGTDITA